MKRTICLALAAMLLLGCTAPVIDIPLPTPVAPGTDDLASSLLTPVVTYSHGDDPAPLLSPIGDQNPATGDVAKGANAFAFQLTSALIEEQADKSENLVCSPYSVWLPLAALVNATEGQAQKDLLFAIGAAKINPEDVNKAASRMLYSLTRQDERDMMAEWAEEAEERGEDPGEYFMEVHDPLSIANAVFVDDDMTLDAGFAKAFADYYRGTAMEVDFASDAAVEAVNGWANEHTNGLIPEIVQEFDPETVAAIANAIYFSDRWSGEFDPNQTEAGIFHGRKGEQEAQFMHREGIQLTYYEDERLQAMPLSFQTGGGMMILLPKDGDANAMMAGITEEYFREIGEDSVQATGMLKLPRFALESDLTLKDALQSLEVNLFDPKLMPLTKLVEETPAYLTSAVQRAVIEVDEKGTTAAAVTVMAAAGASMPVPTEPFEMICDRPFGFILYGQTYDGGRQVLFTGVVNNIGA